MTRPLALQECDLAAPALLRIETANVFRSLTARKALSSATAADLFALLQTAPVLIVDHDDALERRALALALSLDHPVHDCLYLALAERMGRHLITADAKFARRAAEAGHSDRVRKLGATAN